MTYKINQRFGKLCGGMILVVFLLSGWAVLTGCAPAESGTTGGQDLKQGTGPDQQSSAGGTAAGAGMNLNGAAFKNRGDLAFTWQGILYVLYGDSGEVKQLSDSGQAFYPTWSADGQWIAFLTPKAKSMLFAMPQGNGELGAASTGSANMDEGKLWLVSRDGRESRVIQGLPELPIVPASVSWSPAGSILAIQGQGEIWLVPAQGEPYQVSGTEKFSGLSGWSPDGKSLVCYSEPALSQEDKISGERRMIFYSYNLDTGRLTTTGQLKMPAGTGTLFAAWRPDAQGMLYWPDPAYSASLAADGLELQSLRWGESQPQVLPCGLGYRPWLSFFPDGRLLMVAGGGIYQPSWSKDGTAILYVRDNSLWLVEADDGKPQKIIGPFPDWSEDLFGYYGYVWHDNFAWFSK